MTQTTQQLPEHDQPVADRVHTDGQAAGTAGPVDPYSSASDVRRANRLLDEQIRSLASSVPEAHLHDALPEGRWTLAEHLGHLAEFPRTFARQLDQWLDRERVVVGRVGPSDTDRWDALVRARERRLRGLLDELETSLAQLSRVLDRVEDGHLTATVEDVAEGRVPLVRFLERYVIGHKREQVGLLAAELADI